VPRLSIVIPCSGGAAEFDGVLVSVLQNRPANCEIIVAHAESYDDPYDLDGEVTFIHAPDCSPVELLNAAIHHCTGEIIHFLGCGLQTVEGWTAPALAHFQDPQVAAVAPMVLNPDGQTLLSAGVSWSLGGARRVISDQRVTAPGSGRLRAKILGPALMAAFYRRDILLALDGFDPAIGIELSDVNIALAIESLGKLHVSEPASQLIQTAAESPSTGSFTPARDSERLFWRNISRRNAVLAAAVHPFSCLYNLATSKAPLLALLGRIWAFAEIGAAKRYRHQLDLAIQRLTELETLRSKSRRSHGESTHRRAA
jgi:hypothetical protein